MKTYSPCEDSDATTTPRVKTTNGTDRDLFKPRVFPSNAVRARSRPTPPVSTLTSRGTTGADVEEAASYFHRVKPADMLCGLLTPLLGFGLLVAPGSTRPAHFASRHQVITAINDPNEPRDPMVERATSGGWGALLPRRGAIINVVAIGAVAALAGDDTWLGRALNSSPFETQEVQRYDDAGTPLEPTEKLAPTAGLALIVGYNLFGLFFRRPLEKQARELREKKDDGDQGPGTPPASE